MKIGHKYNATYLWHQYEASLYSIPKTALSAFADLHISKTTTQVLLTNSDETPLV